MLPVSLIAEISQAKIEWLLAYEEFNNADEAFVNAAVWKLQAAIEKYDALMRLAKQEMWRG